MLLEDLQLDGSYRKNLATPSLYVSFDLLQKNLLTMHSHECLTLFSLGILDHLNDLDLCILFSKLNYFFIQVISFI